MKRHIAWAASLVLVAPTSSYAATANGTLGVSVSIVSQCTVATNAVAFGSKGLLTANIDSTGSVDVNCTKSTTFNVGFDQGANASAVNARKMKGGVGGTDLISYMLTRDAAFAQNWGNTVGTDTLAGTGTGSVQSLTVYARIPAQAAVSPGAYADVVNVTVTY